MHVDDFIDDSFSQDNEKYARWVLMYYRLPAVMINDFKEFMKGHLLFCTWEGKRYRVNGASRLGDIWLTADYDHEYGYEHRVDLETCSNWGSEP